LGYTVQYDVHSAPQQAGDSSAAASPPGRFTPLKRAALLAAMTALIVNVWTGSPLLALWLGSRVQGSGPPQMAPVFVVAISLGVFSFLLLLVIRRLGAAYDRVTGRRPTVREHVPWLRSLRGERPHEAGDDYSLSALEILLCAIVILVLGVFEYWFFFESTSSIDQRSGRG
jgi:hypothetical protein